MRAIHKYPLQVGHNHVPAPVARQVLSVAAQPGATVDELVMWAAVDTDSPKAELEVFVVPTGTAIDHLFSLRIDGRYWEFVGTVQAEGRTEAWHVFVLRR